MDVPLWAWLALFAGVLAMLALDLVMHREAHVITLREAGVWSAYGWSSASPSAG